MSTTSKILELDLNTMKIEDVNFSNAYQIKIKESKQIHGLVCWFDCIFEDQESPRYAVTLTTSPWKPVTHWKQTSFYLDLFSKEGNFKMEAGDTLKGSVACSQNAKNKRELDVKISYHHIRSGEELTSAVELYKVR